MWQIARCDFLTCWLAIHRSGSPTGNQLQHRTIVNDGGIYHTKNNNNIHCVYVLQCTWCMSLVPYICVYKRMHCNWGYIYCGSIDASASNLLINVLYFNHVVLSNGVSMNKISKIIQSLAIARLRVPPIVVSDCKWRSWEACWSVVQPVVTGRTTDRATAWHNHTRLVVRPHAIGGTTIRDWWYVHVRPVYNL